MALRLVPKTDDVEQAVDTSAANSPQETGNAKREDQLENTIRYSPFNVVRKRRDAGDGLANSNQANGFGAARDSSAPEHVRDASVVLGQRIANGRAIGFEDVASIGGEGVRVAGGGIASREIASSEISSREISSREIAGREIASNEITSLETEGGLTIIIRPGVDSDDLPDGSRSIPATKHVGASASSHRVSERPAKRLVRCFYCGAGTAPQYLDLQDRPMCGGCHRDLGFGKKVSRKRAKRMADQRDGLVESASFEGAALEGTTFESTAFESAIIETGSMPGTVPETGSISAWLPTASKDDKEFIGKLLEIGKKHKDLNSKIAALDTVPVVIGSTDTADAKTRALNEAFRRLTDRDARGGASDESPAPSGVAQTPPMDNAAVAVRKRKKRASVVDLTLKVPAQYIVRKFDGAKLGGHSEACVSTRSEGCIPACPLRIEWEADGRPAE